MAPPAYAAGSLLVDETFTGSTVADPGFRPLSDACLTGSTTTTDGTTLGRCTRNTQAPTPGQLPGYLQLNDTRRQVQGALVYNRPIPASSGIDIEFDQYQYSSGTNPGDGISFFLVDGATNLTQPGAYGGSLGYAQLVSGTTNRPGVNGGYLGVGLDAYGNFGNDGEGRGSGCSTHPTTGLKPNTITLRGPGQGTSGYCWLGSATSPASLHVNTTASTPADSVARRIRITVSPDPIPVVTVYVNGTRVLQRTMPSAAPSTFKFGFAASTGGATDTHLIRNVKVSTINPLAAISLTKQIDRTSTQPAAYAPGDTIPYQFLVTNSTVATITNVTVTDPRISDISCRATTLGPAGSPTASMTCTGSYVVQPEDDDTSTTLTNTATVTGTSGGGTVTASDSVNAPLVPRADLGFQKIAQLQDANSNNAADLGETINYSFVVSNPGNVPLSGITVTDPKVGAVSCPQTTVAPGASVTCTATYTVTQPDVDAGKVLNTATVRANPPSGGALTKTSSAEVAAVGASPQIVLEKTGTLSDTNGNGLADAGEQVTYSFVVRNVGNVTLSGITVTDPKVGAVTCAQTPLAPTESMTCTAAPYTVTQGDVDSGEVTNTASTTGTTPADGTVTDDDTEDIDTVAAAAQIVITKQGTLNDANSNQVADAGETITYSFTVRNAGNVTLSDITASDPRIGAISCPQNTLAPGASMTCTTATLTVGQPDVDAGEVVNTATVTSTKPGGGAVSDDDTETIDTATPAPAITIAKTGTLNDANGNNAADVGETVTYTFTVRNAGNVTLDGIAVSDPKVGAVSCPQASLAPNASMTCTAATYTVTQDDIDAGEVFNTATVTGTDPSGSTVSGTGTAEIPAVKAISQIVIEKTGTLDDANANNAADEGETVAYTFTVRNAGNVTLDNIAVSDPKVGAVSCPQASLAPNASMTCTAATYTVTQGDIDAGAVTNTATVTGTDPAGAEVTDDGTSAITTVPASAQLVLTKTGTLADANSNQLADVDETITYSFEVRNAGNVTLDGITVEDPKLGAVSCPAGPLAPGASVTCTAAPYTVTQDDVDAGDVVNTATASGTTPGGGTVSDDDSVQIATPDAAPGLALEKAGALDDANGNQVADVGETVTYSFTVRNTGNVTINGLSVDDPKLGAVSCAVTALAPGASTTCTAPTYTVTQADIDSGEVANTATATGTDPGGEEVDATGSTTVDSLTPVAGLALTKSGTLDDANGNNAADLDETVNYTFTVTNTGNVTLTGIAVDDPKIGAVTCPVTELAPGTSTTCTAAAYTVTQADIDAGGVLNTATATGTPPSGPDVDGTASSRIPTTKPAPQIVIVKTGELDDTNGNGSADVGETIEYSFAVRNAGNVTLTGVTVEDPKLGAVTCPSTTLPPAASMSCTAGVYTVTQADVDAGGIYNTATATATPPTGDPVTDDSTSDIDTVPAASQVTVVKSAALNDANANNAADFGEIIDYQFVVANLGNVTLTDISVDDPKAGVVSCPSATLAPGDSMTCTAAPYTVGQADIDTGSVRNTATVSGTPPTGPAVSDDDSANVPTVAASAQIVLTKTATLNDANGNNAADVGESIDYSFTVDNAGNVTLTNVVVDDPKAGAVSCPTSTLAPGASMTCTATYTVTQSDVDAGSVVNTATATGTPPTGPDVTNTSEREVPAAVAEPSIGLVKVGTLDDTNSNDAADVGETITYTFTVTNSGNVTATNLDVTDDKLGAVTCAATELAPGDQTTCTAAPHTVTQADVDAGSVTNVATAVADVPGGTVGDESTDVIETTDPVSVVGLVKSGVLNDANGNQGADVGETIEYTFTVTNTGNVTISNIGVGDDKVGAVSCPVSELAPGAQTTCTAAPYTVTQADVDAGAVLNTATAGAIDPNGRVLEAEDTNSVDTVDAVGGIDLQKIVGLGDANQNGLADVGEELSYEFYVTNIGNVSVSGLSVSDPRVGTVSCPVDTLDPGEFTVCTAPAVYVTQADVDAGEVLNTATATAQIPGGDPVSDESSVTIDTTRQVPGLALEKAGALTDGNSNGVADVGETIEYTFTVTNTGNVSLSDLSVSDPKIGAVSCPVTELAPGAQTTCTAATYTVTQSDVDSGAVVNTATATANDPSGDPTGDEATQTVPTITPAPQITVVKSGALGDANGNGLADVGESVDYTFTVTNVGNVTIAGISVDDPKVGTVTCPVTELAPGAQTTCTAATYTVSQADIDSGSVANTATATGTDPGGNPVSDDGTSTISTVTPAPQLVLAKTSTLGDANGNGLADVGESVYYTFTITNVGNVTLSGLTVDDPKIGAVTCPTTPLAPGESATCTAATYTVTQGDIDAGGVRNEATGTATTPGDGSVSDDASDDAPTTVPSAALGLDKTVVNNDPNGNGLADVGEELTYTFTVSNLGNVTISGISVEDPMLGAVICPASELGPGESMTCTAAAYTVTQADVDQGDIVNEATATGTDPGGNDVTDTGSAEVDTVTAVPGVFVAKQSALNDTNDNGVADVGESIDYSFVVTNTGNVTVSSVSVSDPKAGTVSCPQTELAPGAQMTCTASAYTATQDDIDAGGVLNTAVVTAEDPSGNEVTDDSDNTVPTVAPAAQLVLEKSGSNADANGNQVVDNGDEIDYTFTVTNVGNVTITGISVSDPKLGEVSCPATSLAPGDSMTCTAAPYTVTQDDVDAGSVDNSATVTGTQPGGGTVTDTDEESIDTVVAAPQLIVTKTGALDDANGNGLADVGETITYTLTVANTGNVTITGISVSDPKIAGVTCPATTLVPGASMTCTAPVYTVTQADVDASQVDNTATATGSDPGGNPVSDDGSSSIDAVASVSGLTLVKTGVLVDGDDNAQADVGETVDYTFEVTNTGNVTISGIAVSDPKVGAVACPAAELAPGAQMSCTASYVVTQADVDAGEVRNTATVSGTDPTGATVDDTSESTIDTRSVPNLQVDKYATPDVDPAVPGTNVAYRIVVTNVGTTTLSDITVSDPLLPGLTCTGGESLAPGSSFECTGSYVVTELDLFAGAVDNVATATGTSTDGSTVTDSGGVDVHTVQPVSPLSMEKTGTLDDSNDDGVAQVGETIDYTFEITNNGNVTVRNLTVDDPKIGAVTCPVTTLAPGESVICTGGPYTVTQADVDAGEVLNTATATGIDPIGGPSDVDDTSTVPTVPSAGGLTLDKTATYDDANDNGTLDPGETVSYIFVVTNSGNVTISGIRVVDPKLGTLTCGGDTVAPGGQLTCTAPPYTVTEADVQAGVITNTATATGTDPSGQSVSDDDTHEITPADPGPGLSVDKQATISGGASAAAVGDEISYSFVVTNTGNLTVSAVSVSDPLVGAVTCPATSLAPGESMTCTAAPYTVTQADVDAGGVANNAVVTGTSGDDTVTGGDNVTTPTSSTTSVAAKKSVDKQTVNPGGTLDYTITLTNDGTTTAQAAASDDLGDVLEYATLVGPPAASAGAVVIDGTVLQWSGTLAPGDSVTITYTVRVDRDAPDGAVLSNQVVTDVPGGTCQPGGGDDDCGTETVVDVGDPAVVPQPPIGPGLPPPLAKTGFSAGALVIAALVLLGVGLLAQWSGRRRS